MKVNKLGRTYTPGKALDNDLRRLIIDKIIAAGGERCNLNGRENDERTQVDTNTNKITPGLNGA